LYIHPNVPSLAPNLYVKRPGKPSDFIKIEGFDLRVPVPFKPSVEQMVNYGLPEEDQKFARTVLPANLESMEIKDQKPIVAAEWHKRLHGLWVLIKGQPFYLPGTAYVYYNYWVMEDGQIPTFRMEGLELFQIWDMVENDDSTYGLVDIKGRRLGDTDKFSFLEWEWVTRYKNQWAGQQNVTEREAQQAFDRIVQANRTMPFFFRPKNDAMDAPKEELIFRYPPSKTRPSTKLYHVGSRIDYKPTRLKMYDGKRLARYRMDECFKISPADMDVEEQWKIVRLCLSLNNGKRIIGKAVLLSTVEHMAGGATVRTATNFWNQSDPTNLNANGRTVTGLWRVFRNFEKSAEVDDWGFHKTEEARKHRQAEIDALMAQGSIDDVASLKRKMPDTIDEALAMPAEDCILFPVLLDNQIETLSWRAMNNDPQSNYGDLVWKNGFGSDVMFIPNPKGRLEICQHPTMPNVRSIRNGQFSPGNTEGYAIGIDPIDHTKPVREGSFGAVAVYRPYDQLEEDPVIFNEKGEIVLVDRMKTDLFVCAYRYRPMKPYEFYEDALKIMIYYGCKAFIERDKPGIINYLEDKGFVHYLAAKPHAVAVRDRGVLDNTPGAKASTPIITSYIEAIKTHVAERHSGYKLVSLLQDYRNFTGENRGERDLTVAAGFALLLGRKLERSKSKINTNKRWTDLPIKLYSNHGSKL
jgi:hypothetical protein